MLFFGPMTMTMTMTVSRSAPAHVSTYGCSLAKHTELSFCRSTQHVLGDDARAKLNSPSTSRLDELRFDCSDRLGTVCHT